MRELAAATGLPAAASFKHVSPAGAAVYAPLAEEMLPVYEAVGKDLSKTAIAYLRSRQADPLCSFGDFVAVSGVVDLSTANLLKIEARALSLCGFCVCAFSCEHASQKEKEAFPRIEAVCMAVHG